MATYTGIIIKQSLKDTSIFDSFTIHGSRGTEDWKMVLVSVPEEDLDVQIRLLQDHMIESTKGKWYVHFFWDEILYIVYQNAVYRTTIHPKDWGHAVAHGLSMGIPPEQLDFVPLTREEAFKQFGL